MLYKLDSIDAYEQKLVKQIEVASIQVKDGHNKAYMKLLAVDNKNGPPRPRLRLTFSKPETPRKKLCGSNLAKI